MAITPEPGAKLAVLVHVPLFLAGSLAWMLSLALVAGVVAALVLGGPGDVTAIATDPTFLGVASIVQIAGMGLLAVGLAELFRRRLPTARSRRLGPILGIVEAPFTWWLVAMVTGVTVWTFPSWLAALLTQWWDWEGTVPMVSRALAGPWPGVAPLLLAVVVAAPLFEELIFRGYLWRVMAGGFGHTTAFIVTTLLFALYHLDPVQGLALLPTAALFGFLRWQSGSIGPPVLAHFLNNGLGVLFARLSPAAATQEALPLWLAVAGLGVALAACAGGWWASGGRAR